MNVTRGAVAIQQLTPMEAAPVGKAPRKLYDSVVDIEDNRLAVVELAMSSQTQLRAPLNPVRRVKLGRLRIFFIVNQEKTEARVLFLGFRKEGDKSDAYRDIEALLRGTSLDQEFAALGVTKPTV